MKLKSLFAIGALSVASLLAAAPASATSIQTPWQVQNFAFDNIDGQTTLNYNGFDASLGSLVGVTVEFSVSAVLFNTVVNLTGHPVNVGSPMPLSAKATIDAIGPLGMFLEQILTTPGYTGTIAPTPNGTPITVGQAETQNMTLSMTLPGDPSTLAAYIGGIQSILFSIESEGTQGGSVPKNVFTGDNGNSHGSVSVAYLYDLVPPTPRDVPEPASIALFALGLIGLAAMRRRKG